MSSTKQRRRLTPLRLMACAGLVGLGAAVYLVAAGLGQKQQDRGKAVLTSELALVQRSSFDITTTATGDLRAQKQKEIRSELETESIIVEIVAEGSVVKTGDLLIKLNGDPIQTQIDEESLRVESANAELIAAENGFKIQRSENESKLRQARLKLELAQLALEQWDKGERVQKEKDIELALDETAKELQRLKDQYEKSINLEKEGFLSRNQLQMDEIAYRKAVAAREKAELERQTYEQYQKPKDRKSKESDVAEAQAELERTIQQNEIELASKDADRLNKRRQHQMRMDRLAKLQKQLAACTITAPQDGLVVFATSTDSDFMNGQGPLQVGRRVFPNEPLIILPDTTRMMAQVKVHESMAGRVRPGQSASVRVDAAGGQTFLGRVDSVGVLAEGGGWRDPNRREYTVRIALNHDPDDAPLKPSMRCEATIILGTVENSLVVPIQAVFTDELVRFVYTPAPGRGNRFVRVPIGLGQRSDTFAHVTAGLEEGTRVLVRQPQPAEVVQAPWDEAQLKVAGFKLGEDGKPVPVGGPPNPRGQSRGAGRGESAVATGETARTRGPKPETPAGSNEVAAQPKAEPAAPAPAEGSK